MQCDANSFQFFPTPQEWFIPPPSSMKYNIHFLEKNVENTKRIHFEIKLNLLKCTNMTWANLLCRWKHFAPILVLCSLLLADLDPFKDFRLRSIQFKDFNQLYYSIYHETQFDFTSSASLITHDEESIKQSIKGYTIHQKDTKECKTYITLTRIWTTGLDGCCSAGLVMISYKKHDDIKKMAGKWKHESLKTTQTSRNSTKNNKSRIEIFYLHE